MTLATRQIITGCFLLVATLTVLLTGLYCDRPAQGDTSPAPGLERAGGGGETHEATAWVHPLAAFLGTKNWCRGIGTADLYRQAISWDVPIRTGRFTKYHPNEASGMGGGWGSADGQGFRQGLLACSTRYWRYWRGHEFWVQGYGRAVVGDNGPGWSGKYQWDIAAFSAAEVNALDRGPGHLKLRYVVVRCPRYATCSCDAAVAWRKHKKAKP